MRDIILSHNDIMEFFECELVVKEESSQLFLDIPEESLLCLKGLVVQVRSCHGLDTFE